MDILPVLRNYGIEEITSVSTGGGTACSKYIIQTPAKKYLLRERRKEFCPLEIILFDRSVMEHLRKNSMPVVVAEKTLSGEAVCRFNDRTYELLEYVEGLEDFVPGDKDQITSAAHTLGKMHRLLHNFKPEGKKDWQREFHPYLLKSELEEHVRNLPGIFNGTKDTLVRVFQELDMLIEDFQTDNLTHSIVHGDYTTANVKFRNAKIGSIFDFDWTSFQNTLYDISRGIIYFCFGRNAPVDGSDILSLVQPCQVETENSRVFIDSYRKEFTFTGNDAENLPYALKETILGARIRAMRKVPDTEKGNLLDSSLLKLLDSIENSFG